MPSISHLKTFAGKFLLGVFICSSAWGTNFRSAIKGSGPGSKSVVLIIDFDDFDVKYARQLQDAIGLARAWNGWICKDGQVISRLNEKVNFVIARPVGEWVDSRTRSEMMYEWLWPRIEAAPSLTDSFMEALESVIPASLSSIKPAVSFVFDAKRSGDMRNFYADSRARLHAFRQRNLGLRVVSCQKLSE